MVRLNSHGRMTTFIAPSGHLSVMRWGVKASLNDAEAMAGMEVELLEVHLRPEDLPRHRDAIVTTFRDIRSRTGHDLVVHAPEFMLVPGGPMLLDPSSPDPALRQMALANLEGTIDLCRAGSIPRPRITTPTED